MIALAIFTLGVLLVARSARALDDAPSGTDDSRGVEWLLFALVLCGVVAHHVKRKRDADDD